MVIPPKVENYSFGGRLKPKQNLETQGYPDILKLERLAVAYLRLSTYEQIKNSQFSLKRQYKLEQKAIREGYKSALSAEEIKAIRENLNYPGYYTNGQVVVIEADLGISGAKGQEERPGLAHLIMLIEANLVESVFIIDITRLFRDNTLINPAYFAQICKEHDVIIVTERMRFNLRNKAEWKFFMMQAEYGGEELEWLLDRLGGARKEKSQGGFFAGGKVATGFCVDLNPKNIHKPKYHLVFARIEALSIAE